MYTYILLRIAIIFIASAGVCVILQRVALATRLLSAGCIVAAAAGIAANLAESNSYVWLRDFALLLGTAGLCAALFGARRWPYYLIVPAILCWILIPLIEPVAREVRAFWWVLPLVVVIPIAAALLATAALRGLRAQVHRAHPATAFSRFLGRVFDQVIGVGRRRHRRDRHIGDVGMTRRGRSGPGPHTI